MESAEYPNCPKIPGGLIFQVIYMSNFRGVYVVTLLKQSELLKKTTWQAFHVLRLEIISNKLHRCYQYSGQITLKKSVT